MTDHYDVIVIGSGAGGGTLIRALAPTGKRILLLERGGWMPREIENWDSKAVWIDKRYANAGKWTDAETGKKFTPKQHCYVGGNTKVYGAILFRFREQDSSMSTGCRRPGRSPTTTSTRGTTGPSASTRSTANVASTRPSRHRTRPTRSRPSATSRGSSNCPTT